MSYDARSLGTLVPSAAATAASTAPELIGSTPLDNAADVSTLADLRLNFSEAVLPGTGSISLYHADGRIASTFDVQDAGHVRFSGSKVSIDPGPLLAPASHYYLAVEPGAIVDEQGTAFAGISSPTALDFHTEAHAPLAIGATRTGRLTDGDQQVYEVSLVAGYTYSFSMRAGGAASGVETLLWLYDGTGAAVRFDGGMDRTSANFGFTAATTGTHFLVAADLYDYAIGNGNYSVTARTVADDYLATPDTTGRITAGGNAVRGSIQFDGDSDHFRVALTAGTMYRFAVAGVDRRMDTTLLVRDEAGHWLGWNDDAEGQANGASSLTVVPGSSGTHFVEVGVDDGSKGRYELRAVELPDDLPATPATGATVLVDGDARLGRIDFAGDIDYVKVNLQAGVKVVFDLAAAGEGPVVDPLLSLFGPANELLARDEDSGSGGSKNGAARITFTPEATGTYYLAAAGEWATVGGFELRATQGDATAPQLLGTTPADGATISRTSEFMLQFDEPVVRGSGHIDMRTTDGTLVERIDVQDGERVWFDGSTVRVRPLAELPAASDFTLELDAGVLLDEAANAFAGLGGDDAPVFHTAVDDFDAGIGGNPQLVVDGAASGGVIEVAGDADRFAVDLDAGFVYDFLLEPAGDASSFDAWLVLYDANNQFIGSAGSKNAPDARLAFTPQAGGTYYLVAQSNASGTGAYALSASLTGPDTEAPQLVATTPAADDTIARNVGLQLQFDEPVQAGSGSIVIHRDDGTLVHSIDVADAAQVGFSGNTVHIQPLADLPAGSDLRLELAAGAVTDAAGNAFAGLAGNDALAFNTATDDADAAIGNNPVLAVDAAARTGTIEIAGDIDRYRVELDAGSTYTFRTDASGGSAFDGHLILHDAADNVVAAGGSKSASASIEYTAESGGGYYLVVAHEQAGAGAYTVGVELSGSASADTGVFEGV